VPNLEEQALPAAEKLLRADESQLYEQLGMRIRAMAEDLSIASSFEPTLRADESLMGAKEELREAGRLIFDRWQVEAHKLVCGGRAQDTADRSKLLDAIGVGEVAAAAALSALLVAHLGLAAPLAPVVAALVIKRFFRPAHEELCRVWAKNLPRPEA